MTESQRNTPDREKVISGLESLRDICNAKADMAIGEGRTAWAGYASVVHLALALLREQEPVMPIDENYWKHTEGRCGHCRAPLPAVAGLRSKFCWMCGRKVKWND